MPARLAVCLGLILLAACGGGSPTGPSGQPGPSPTPAPNPTPTPTPTPTPAPGPVTLRTAMMMGANGHVGSGTARIVRESNDHRLEFGSSFMVAGASNSDVILTNSTTSMDGLNLGDLRRDSGAQAYSMPNDGSAYRYVMIWCRPFRIPIGIGELR